MPKKIDKTPIHSPLQNTLFHSIDVPFSICF
ncbi:glycine dehydrogenase [Vibrio sp. MED222]|nr:glycine dehydrogenase [Vibrio sp. MED222]